MMIITSGAVAFGRQTLRNELSMQQTMRDSLKFNTRRMVIWNLDFKIVFVSRQFSYIGRTVSIFPGNFSIKRSFLTKHMLEILGRAVANNQTGLYFLCGFKLAQKIAVVMYLCILIIAAVLSILLNPHWA